MQKIMQRQCLIEIDKQYFNFSAAHFTIFSATERERLHGHDYQVSAKILSPVGDDGLCFNYQLAKSRLKRICAELDEYMLLPGHSPHLKVEEDELYFYAFYNQQRMSFLKEDTKVLPVTNITVEELTYYLLKRFLEDQNFIDSHQINRLEIRISSGTGQWGNSIWERSET